MKDTRMVFLSSPCDVDLYNTGPNTIAEVRSLGKNSCPNRSVCDKTLHPEFGFQCIMYYAVEVVKNAVKAGRSIQTEMEDFKKECPKPRGGFYWSSDRENFATIVNREEIFKKVEEFASELFNSLTIKQVGSSYNDLVNFCTFEGRLDTRLMEMFEGRYGSNGSQSCDTGPGGGPCSCGAWH